MRTVDKSKFYLNLKKCTEEEQKHVFSLLPPTTNKDYEIHDDYKYLHFIRDIWFVDYRYFHKTELTYPEFIKLFEGEESKEILQVESNGWIKILSEKDLPKTFQELILYREDAGVFVGYYGNLAESLSEIAVENHYNNEVSEETMWKEQFFYFGLEGNGILEGSEGPTHWMPLPEPPKF